MLTLPRRSHLIIAFCIAAVFAVPLVTFVSCLVVFPIVFYGALAVAVNVGLILLPLAVFLDWSGIYRVDAEVWHKWLLAAIIWTGCAIGFANWGVVASTMGAKNKPFLDVFFSPILLVLGYPVG